MSNVRDELYARAVETKDHPTEPGAAYFAGWLVFYMDEVERLQKGYDEVLAAARYVAGVS